MLLVPYTFYNDAEHDVGLIKLKDMGRKNIPNELQLFIPSLNTLQTDYPNLATEWDSEKNLGITPDSIDSNSTEMAWWKCPVCGFSWKASITSRVKGSGCPSCRSSNNNKTHIIKQIESRGSLRQTNPSLAAEWHPTKNGTLTPDNVLSGSNKKVWWLCTKCKHEWEASIGSRNRGTGCPRCSFLYRTSEPEQAVFFYLKKYFADTENEWSTTWLKRQTVDMFVPSLELAIEYDGAFWHKDEQRDLKKAKVLKEHGIKLIRLREQRENSQIGDGSFVIPIPKSSYDLNYLNKPLHALFSIINELYSLCIVPDIDLDRDYIAITKLFEERKREKSLANLAPNLLVDWDYEKNTAIPPELIPALSSKKVWWKCNMCGNEWQASAAHRFNGRGCPECDARKKKLVARSAKHNSLADIHPDFIDEWDYNKNDECKPSDYSLGSSRSVWWKCKKCGHEWQAPIKARSRGRGCPRCGMDNTTKAKWKPILQYDLEGHFVAEYPSILEAARVTGINKTCIGQAARGITKQSGGFVWVFKNANKD